MRFCMGERSDMGGIRDDPLKHHHFRLRRLRRHDIGLRCTTSSESADSAAAAVSEAPFVSVDVLPFGGGTRGCAPLYFGQYRVLRSRLRFGLSKLWVRVLPESVLRSGHRSTRLRRTALPAYPVPAYPQAAYPQAAYPQTGAMDSQPDYQCGATPPRQVPCPAVACLGPAIATQPVVATRRW